MPQPTPPPAIPLDWLGGIIAALGALAYLVKLGRVLQRLDSLSMEVQTLTTALSRDSALHHDTAKTLAVLVARVESLERDR